MEITLETVQEVMQRNWKTKLHALLVLGLWVCLGCFFSVSVWEIFAAQDFSFPIGFETSTGPAWIGGVLTLLSCLFLRLTKI